METMILRGWHNLESGSQRSNEEQITAMPE